MAKRRKADQQQSQREHVQPSEEWGERLATGRAIARGGKKSGAVPGAVEQPAKTAPGATRPALGDDASSERQQHIQAAENALRQLGNDADAQRVCEAVRRQTGIELDPDVVETVRRRLNRRE